MRILIENPIIIVILLGIISSLFKRIKSDQPEEGRSRKRNLRQNGLPSGQHKKSQLADRSKPNKPVRQQNTRSRMVENATDPIDPIFVNSNIQESENNQMDYSAVNQNDQEILEFESTQKKNTLDIDRTKLIDGLIWSEVLGPPRAKKTHHSIKAYGKKQ
jgi:Tfp pilus assembly protein PilV